MKKEKVLKLVIVMAISIALIAMSTQVFALTSEDLFSGSQTGTGDGTSTGTGNSSDDGDYLDITGTVNPGTTTPAPSTPTPSTNTPTTNTPSGNTNGNNYNTNIPHAGATENTIIGVVAVALVITAVFAYRKFNEYKNI